MFTEKFDDYVTEDATITCKVDKFEATATIYRDDNATPPWEREDGHGEVTGWVTREKKPGERLLSQDGRSCRYYDFAGAVKKAKADGWGDGKGTKAQRAAKAAEDDFRAMKAWCDDEWWYVGVAVTVTLDDVPLTGQYDHALWGVDCNHPLGNNDYLQDVANENLGEAIEAAKKKLAKLCKMRECAT